MMDYPRYRQAGYPIASAAIESTNKRLVSRRCKQGGMLWGETGLEAILALRAAMFNPGAWYGCIAQVRVLIPCPYPCPFPCPTCREVGPPK
jgi:hypothetical protein